MRKHTKKPLPSEAVTKDTIRDDEYAIGDENYIASYADNDEYEDDDEPAIGYDDEYEDEYEDEDEPAIGYDDEYEDEDEPAIGYDDEYEEEDEDDDPPSPVRGKSVIDWCLTFGAVAAAVVILAIGCVYGYKVYMQKEFLKSYAEIGNEIEGLDIIGGPGLVAAHGAKVAEKEAILAAMEEEASNEEEQIESTPSPAPEVKKAVVMNLTSVQKDLKIKFVNTETQSLVTGVIFEIAIVAPGNKNISKTDDDGDGIIYLKDLAAGQYKVALTGPSEGEYLFSTDPVTITVKDKIEYKKIDIKDEIKKESEINAAKEDTAKNDTVEESKLEDTVKWSESSKTEIGQTDDDTLYTKIDKDDITDPAKTAYLGMKLLSHRYEPEDENNEPSENDDNSEGGKDEATPSKAPENEEATPSKESEVMETPSPSEKASESPAKEKNPEASNETPTSSKEPDGENTEETPEATPSETPENTEENKAKEDHESVLKTRDGKTVYVKDNGSYREAKYADYYTFEEFYCKSEDAQSAAEYKYTGWQHLDGYTYFFGEDGLFVTGEQVIQGAKYVFDDQGHLTNGSGVLGIDVSKWNGDINWSEVKNSGVNYVIIRCGYRGSSVGALVEDPMFRSNISGAQKAGLKVGVYFFSQAVNEIEAVEEASMVLSLVSGYNLTYPIFLDVEKSGGRADGMSTEERTLVCEAFCKTIANSGYKSGVYANKTWFNEKINTPSISGYKIWLAQYSAAPTYNRTRYDIWQYTSKGSVGGIKGNVDMNISYLGY